MAMTLDALMTSESHSLGRGGAIPAVVGLVKRIFSPVEKAAGYPQLRELFGSPRRLYGMVLGRAVVPDRERCPRVAGSRSDHADAGNLRERRLRC